MRNVQLILLEHCAQLKTQLIVHPPGVFPRNDALLISDFLALAPPSLLHAEAVLILGHGVNGRRHSVVEQRVGFGEVYHVENILTIGQHVLDGEVEPLIVAD